MTWHDSLSEAQQRVDAARDVLARQRLARDATIASARADGETIYGIAKALGLSQGAVRKVLGL